ncbi:hypothetical protein [Rhodococcus sp. IEGM 1408]|uniref:hypothetical protein n=1 Tax=Rhodococcus sp. IEGM 1408 TaxID=3082220 RepID=UPI0029557DB0|nr:hypothetical protein [Rhodococcus sp. IEGM 1408]MDV8002469.1 hypothetical protein [Rhodococcus sp. IEGM 1408]
MVVAVELAVDDDGAEVVAGVEVADNEVMGFTDGGLVGDTEALVRGASVEVLVADGAEVVDLEVGAAAPEASAATSSRVASLSKVASLSRAPSVPFTSAVMARGSFTNGCAALKVVAPGDQSCEFSQAAFARLPGFAFDSHSVREVSHLATNVPDIDR